MELLYPLFWSLWCRVFLFKSYVRPSGLNLGLAVMEKDPFELIFATGYLARCRTT